MKTLITGATGLVGSHIAEKLCREGEEVWALVRTSSNTRFLEGLGVKLRYGSITDPLAVYEAVEGMDRVCHAAALTEEWTSRELAYEVNVEGTENLLEASLARGVERFLFVSSLSVMGFRNHYNTGLETDYAKPGDPYIDTKMDAEQLVRRFSRFGLATTILRPGFMYGPRDRRFLQRILSHLEKGTFKFVGDGKNKMNLNYAGNFADAVVLAVRTPGSIGQVYNIANDDKSLDMQTFIFKVADLWGFARPNAHIPVIIAKAATSIMERSAKIMRKKQPPLLTKTRLKFLSHNLEFDISKAKEDLGFENRVGIDQGLALTKEWMEASRQDDHRAEEARFALHVQGRPHD
ncbi:MAG: NAD-dependent epimerase/dehydratase family protein [Phycisphaerae bacterium]|nr:NAD-dependent epimerase/dehydratase family protein [Phycisphaerae bacterium]